MGEALISRRGGRGDSLNYSIVGGTSEPSTPKENTIWINTSTAITSHIFSATEPETPTEGMVWITTGTSSTVEFNALKKNGIQVYPIFSKQYIGGAWVDKTAKIYRGGVWVEWTKYLYNQGDECTGLTGGWTSVNGMTGYTNTGTYTDNGDSFTLAISNYPTAIHRITKSKVDLSEVSKIHVQTISPTVYYQIVVSNSNTDLTNGTVAYIENTSRAPGVLSLDVSGLSGSYHIAVRHINGAGNDNRGSVTVARIWLE